jgi:ABC-type lipoprotein release transport system permease subunit
LGASSARIGVLVVSRAMALRAAGAVLGVGLVALAMAIAAAGAPAYRAVRADPMETLRR